MGKRVLIGLTVMALVIVSACSSSKSSEPPANESPKAGQASEAPKSSAQPSANAEGGTLPISKNKATISYYAANFPFAPVSNDMIVFKELEARTNVNIDWKLVPAEELEQKLNVLVSSGNIPDVMVGPPDMMNKFASKGLFIKLDDLLAKYGQHIMKKMDDENGLIKKMVKNDKGEIYYIPQFRSEIKYLTASMIQTSVLKELNLKAPATLDELSTTLKAMKAKYPNSYPISKRELGYLTLPIFSAYDVSDDFRIVKGQLTYPPYESPKFKEALKYLSTLYKDNLIDKEYITNTTEIFQQKVKEDKVFFMSDSIEYIPIFKDMGKQFEGLAPLKGPYGDQFSIRRPAYNKALYVSAKAKDPELIVKWLDYLFTDEGITLTNWGIKGDTYTEENGVRKFADKIVKHEKGGINGARSFGIFPEYFVHYQILESRASLLSPAEVAGIKAMDGTYQPLLPPLSGTQEEDDKYAKIMTDVNKYVKEMIDKFIVGKANIDTEYDAYLQTLKKMNVEEAIGIKKAQYDKYLKR
ncbi:extracellular solute-binding protein [Paenibacillus cymbidii]|uniref:extracellular solute-binding protein n=1 Tax=Paenibacillus cymbidii TaxID=1639034 RepID=UPI0010806DA5|nr:extracellular solute-binding protein [Paenibacillus cymbidii]